MVGCCCVFSLKVRVTGVYIGGYDIRCMMGYMMGYNNGVNYRCMVYDKEVRLKMEYKIYDNI